MNDIIMPRGCTVVHTVKIPELPNSSMIRIINVTYVQNDMIVLEKDDSWVRVDDDVPAIIIPLTQRDTLSFSEKGVITMQIRIVTTANEALKTTIISGFADKVLNTEVL